jgi:hypothetical protein
VESEGYRAEALAKADFVELGELLLRATAWQASKMKSFRYVYILISQANAIITTRHYAKSKRSLTKA